MLREVSVINNKHVKDNNINEKAVKIAMVTLLLLSICFLFLLFKNEGWIEKIDLDNITQTTDFVVDINTLYFGKDSIRIEGVFYKEGEPINQFNNRVLLKEKESEMVYMLPTESFPKKELVAEDDEINYRNIMAVAKSGELDFVNKEYEILFLYESDGIQSYQDTGYTVTSWGNKNEK